MRDFLVSVGIVMMIAGCSSVPVDPATAKRVPQDRVADYTYTSPKPNTRELIIKRDSAMEASGGDTRFYVNGVRTANIANGEVLRIYLPDGKYRLGVKTSGLDESNRPIQEIRVLVAENEDSVFRIFWGANGFSIQPSSF